LRKNEYFMVRVVKRLAPILDFNKYNNILPSLASKFVENLNPESKILSEYFLDW
jgi:hypothetical protein